MTAHVGVAIKAIYFPSGQGQAGEARNTRLEESSRPYGRMAFVAVGRRQGVAAEGARFTWVFQPQAYG